MTEEEKIRIREGGRYRQRRHVSSLSGDDKAAYMKRHAKSNVEYRKRKKLAKVEKLRKLEFASDEPHNNKGKVRLKVGYNMDLLEIILRDKEAKTVQSYFLVVLLLSCKHFPER